MNTYKLISFLILLVSYCLLSSCETVIDPRLDENIPQLVVDAWITDQPGPQQVRLVRTSPYFQNSPAPAVTGAEVTVTDNLGNIYRFADIGNGNYRWNPDQDGLPLGQLGRTYTLSIRLGSDTYTATSAINRVPPIDSLIYDFREEELGSPAGYYAQVFARDFEGPGDTYWIRTYKNGQFLSKPNEVNLAYDAAFSAGGNFDGLTFITPIREAINPFDEDRNGNALPPYTLNDSIFVEIYSITNQAFDFLNEARVLMDRPGGVSELFAQPIFNVRTNIRNTDPNAPLERRAVGFFGASAVSSAGVRVKEGN